jgi:hypothetical protein
MKHIFILVSILAILMVAFSPIMATPAPAQGYLVGQWVNCAVDNASTTSSALDLGDEYERLNIYVPTITAGTVTLLVSEAIDGTYAQLGSSGVGFSSSSGGFYSTLIIAGYRFIKIVTGVTQIGGKVTFRVHPYRP